MSFDSTASSSKLLAAGIAFAHCLEFQERLRTVTRIDELSAELGRVARELGFTFHALVEHADMIGAAPGLVSLQNYPASWAQTYEKAGLHRHDPTRRLARRRPASFTWREMSGSMSLFDSERRMLDDARRAGLGEGFTVPLFVPGQRAASCSFATEVDQPLPAETLGAARLAAVNAFDALFTLMHPGHPGAPELTPQQLLCVLLAAQGKSDKEIGRILSLSPLTVTCYLKAARTRLGVKRRSELGGAALDYGLISIDEWRTWQYPG